MGLEIFNCDFRGRLCVDPTPCRAVAGEDELRPGGTASTAAREVQGITEGGEAVNLCLWTVLHSLSRPALKL